MKHLEYRLYDELNDQFKRHHMSHLWIFINGQIGFQLKTLTFHLKSRLDSGLKQ